MSMRASSTIMVSGLFVLACGSSDEGETTSTPTTKTPVYVTVAGHIEDSVAYTDCRVYGPKRAQLLDFAAALEGTSVAFNLQVSYEWFMGASQCETAALKATTSGLNVIDYLVEHHGFEIDIHQEGASTLDASSGNNFADIRYLGGQVTPHMTETTGFQWDNPAQYAALQAGETGLLHPEFTWKPEILIGGPSVDHTDGDFSRDMTSVGVWIPSGFSEAAFHSHDVDADARMVFVASGPNQHCADWGPKTGCHFQNTADFVEVMVDYIDSEKLASGKLYTTTLFVPQPIIFSADQGALLLAILEQMEPLIKNGKVQYAHFTEVAEVWRNGYGEEPNIVQYDRFEPADYTCQ